MVGLERGPTEGLAATVAVALVASRRSSCKFSVPDISTAADSGGHRRQGAIVGSFNQPLSIK